MKRLLVLMLVTLLPAASFASKNAWTQCGIGAMIFPSTGWAAAISNVIWDLGTTATTSSSTSPGQCSGRGASAGQLIYENLANVEEETAVGQGEHLTALMAVLGCDSSVQDSVISDVRTEFMGTVKDPSYVNKSNLEKTQSLFNNVMDKAGKYHAHCAVAG